MRNLLLPCVFLVAVGAPLSTFAQDEPAVDLGADCSLDKPHVTVSFTGAWSGDVERQALSDLSAALAPQGMSTCRLADPLGEKSIAQVTIQLSDGDMARISIDDSLTNKRVARDVQLRDSADSASALIIAVAVDELLRATWAELSIKRKDPAPEPEPLAKEPEPAPELEELPQLPLPAHRLSLRAAIDSYVIGSTFVGGDIAYGSHIKNVVEWTAFAGPRFAKSNDVSQLGDVRADAVSFGLEGQMPVVRTQKFLFGPELSAAATHAWFQGKPNSATRPDAEGAEFRGWAMSLRGGLFARLVLGSAFLSAQTRVGAPLLALEVTDDSGPIGGMLGLEWTSAVSLGWWWAK